MWGGGGGAERWTKQEVEEERSSAKKGIVVALVGGILCHCRAAQLGGELAAGLPFQFLFPNQAG